MDPCDGMGNMMGDGRSMMGWRLMEPSMDVAEGRDMAVLSYNIWCVAP